MIGITTSEPVLNSLPDEEHESMSITGMAHENYDLTQKLLVELTDLMRFTYGPNDGTEPTNKPDIQCLHDELVVTRSNLKVCLSMLRAFAAGYK